MPDLAGRTPHPPTPPARRPGPILPPGKDCDGRAVSGRILIIDDDVRLAEMVRDLPRPGGLRGGGAPYRRRRASRRSPRGARTSSAYDAVILDIMLPDLDGLEVCRRLRDASDVPDPDAVRARRGRRPHRRPGDRRRRLSAQAVQPARAAGPAEGDPAPPAGRGGARPAPALRPAGDRPRLAHRAGRRARGAASPPTSSTCCSPWPGTPAR